MKGCIIRSLLIAAALLVCTSPSIAAEGKAAPGAPEVTRPRAADKSAAAKKVPAPAALIDINSASKSQLKQISGISDAEADKIIAGRPYGSKAHLVTRDIISAERYGSIKNVIIAKQAIAKKK